MTNDDRGMRSDAVLPRARLQQLVLDRSDIQICTVVAPAGFGKSTFAAELTRVHRGPSVAVNLTADHAEPGSLVESVLDRLGTPPHQLAPGTRAIAVLDDVHLVAGTPAESDLRALVAATSERCLLVLVGRTAPPVDLHRHRLDGTLVEIDANDLRFRTWEVEELFHRVYRVRFPPAEVAALAAATDGWAAGLQLYRHATQRSTEASRRQQLELLRRSRLETVRSYLTANVLGTLDASLRRFALDASVLGKMTPQLCNRLLDRIDGARCLDQLVALQLFTTRADDGSYRFHDVFRSFLESQLASELTAPMLADRYQGAGLLLEEHGAIADAARAFTLAGSAADAERVLAALGRTIDRTTEDATWFDSIPHGLLADHRVRLARARLLVRAGRPADALTEYGALVSDPNSGSIRPTATMERDRLRRWTDPAELRPDPTDWTSVLRTSIARRSDGLLPGLVSDPATVPLVEGFAALVDGDPHTAVRHLDAVDHSLVDRTASMTASACAALAWWIIDGLDPSDVLARLRDDADRDRLTWATRILRALLLAFPLPQDVPIGELFERLDEEARRHGDPWTRALARLALLLGSAGGTLRPQDEPAVLAHGAEAASMLAALGADSLVTWAVLCSTASGVTATGPGAGDVRTVSGGSDRLAALVRVVADAPPGGSGAVPARDDAAGPRTLQELVGSAAMVGAPCRLRGRLLGVFELTVDAVPVNLERLRPRARSVLRLLALRGGAPVHRDVILATLWPESEPVAAGKRLHVAISAIRHELGPAGRALARTGETYTLGGGGHELTTDVAELDAAITGFDRAVRERDHQRADECARAVMALHAGELLTEEGSATWVVSERETRTRAFVAAALHLARRAEAGEDWDAVIRIAELGLRQDRYQDELWGLTISALQRSNRMAELERARSTYSAVLADLGVR